MGELATRRLIDAAATLPPAERALLNLWTQRGLDDDALAAMTGMAPATISARRDQIVAELSRELGLPPEDVYGALRDLAMASAAATATANEPDNGAPPVEEPAEAALASINGAEATIQSEPAGADAQPKPDAAPTSPARRARGLWPTLMILGLIVIVLVVLLVGSASNPGQSGSAAGPRKLSGLPGGLTTAHGSVSLVGSGGNLKLQLSVTGLPPAHQGHYEVWLYNSISDAQALGRLNNGAQTVRLALPANAGHFQWVDVSLQPPGSVNHSGQSVLRAANPAATPH
ncbi:MAG: hypothetical protein ACR2GZ_04160 [Solirubrobacteraceae bacterium]